MELDKSSDIFNFRQSQGKLMQCLNNINENTKFQEFKYNNLFINSFNKEKNLNKIHINIKKEKKNYDDDNKIKINEQSKKFFSFDGENQISEENKIDKSKDNNDNLRNNNIIKNDIHILTTDNNNNNCFDSPIKNKNNNFVQKDSNNTNINSKNLNNFNNNNDSKKNIYSPTKKFKLKINKILLSEEKMPSKGYSIQREKKLLNKNLIGYLTFNSSISIQSKSSIIYDDSFSCKNIPEKPKISDKNSSKLLIFNNMNDSIDKINKKKIIKNNINNKIKNIKKNKANKYSIHTLDNNISKEISINLKFNNYLNRSRNLTNNSNIRKSFTKNERVFKFIMKNKTLPKKNFNNSQNSFNPYIDLSNYNKISKLKNKNTIKFFPKLPKHEKNISSLNLFNKNTIKKKFTNSRNSCLEYSNTSDEQNLYYTINDNKSNGLLIDKRNNTLKSIPFPNKSNLIKVNKKKVNNKNNYIKKVINKIENNLALNSNIYNKLPFANSSKVLKIKDRNLYSLNIEIQDKSIKSNNIHKTSNYINNLKNKMGILKAIKKERLGSYENRSNLNLDKSKKEFFNKKKINNNKNKISLDAHIKKKLNLIKSNNNYLKKENNNNKLNIRNNKNNQKLFKKFFINTNTNQNKHYTSFQNQNFKFSKNLKLETFQNDKNFDYNKQITNIPFTSKAKNINKEKIDINYTNIKKINNSRNKIKNNNNNKVRIKNNLTNNRINKKKALKQKTNYFNSVEIKPPLSFINQDIIKYSILRNNQNNAISKVISVTLGKDNYNFINEKNNNNNQIDNNDLKIDKYKKTIINVNQYYPNYYINTNNVNKKMLNKVK